MVHHNTKEEFLEWVRYKQYLLAQQMAQILAYKWESIDLKDILERIGGDEVSDFNINGLPVDELQSLGFSLWDENGLYLMPIWIVKFLNPNMEVESIDGAKTLLSNADLDVRWGKIAYGVKK